MAATTMPSAQSRTTSATAKKWIGAVQDEWIMYSDNPADYTIGSPIGFGASSIVYLASYHPPSAPAPVACALKVLDLDRLPQSSLHLLTRETQLMSLSKHPNVLRVRGTWMDGHKLYIALRLMRSGSAADVMRYAWPGGIEEEAVRCILKQALEGLNYLHVNGFVHRDLKAANLLIDDDGTVLLGDLGVAAQLTSPEEEKVARATMNPDGAVTSRQPATSMERGQSIGKRKSFVGTPCWMAPEIIARKQYDSSADIWSLGITALELAQGRAPGSRDPPWKVLVKTLQNDPPTLDRSAGIHKYSKAFKEMVERCLVKDPSLRPTAAELLQLPFFKTAKKKSYLVGTLLVNLPPLVDRQERRKQPSIFTRSSIDSWDFTQTLQTTHTISGLVASPSQHSHVSHRSISPPPRTSSGDRLHQHSQERPGTHRRTALNVPQMSVFPMEEEDREEPEVLEKEKAESPRDSSPLTEAPLPIPPEVTHSEPLPAPSSTAASHELQPTRSHSPQPISSASSVSSAVTPITPPSSSNVQSSGFWNKLRGKETVKKKKGGGSSSGSTGIMGPMLERTVSYGESTGKKARDLVGTVLSRTSSRAGTGLSRSK